MGAEIGALGELGASGWPLGLALAVVIAQDRIREARRRAALNRAVHELRRPLQALVLSSAPSEDPPSEPIRAALTELRDLDCEINGRPRRFAPRPVSCRSVVQPTVERWRGTAAAFHRSLVLRWRAGSATIMADPERLGQALDNLIDNAIRHGGLRVCVEAWVFAGGVRISVADSGAAPSQPPGNGDPRHGHGLRIVSAVAAEHGGRFLLRTSPTGTVATLELPFGPNALPAARAAALAP